MAYGEGPGPIAIAHRGGAGLGVENSMQAFARSTALGLRYLETDVRVTADGELVCFHDATLDGVTGGSGPVGRQTLRSVRALRVHGTEPVPTLEEVLDAFPSAYVTVDVKDHAAIAPMVRLLRRPGVAERVCVAGAWDGWLERIRAEVPGVATSLGWRALTVLLACARTGVRPPPGLASAPFAHVPVRLGRVPVFADRVAHLAHDLGVRAVVWTVDDPALMHRLYDAGVDAVITDRPDLLREVLLARGQWPAMGGPAGTGPTGDVGRPQLSLPA